MELVWSFFVYVEVGDEWGDGSSEKVGNGKL